MMEDLQKVVSRACQELFNLEVSLELTRPEEQFGDYSTNVALKLSKQLGKNPREIGEALAEKLRLTLADQIEEVSMAGPGFVNIKLNDVALIRALGAQPAKGLAGQVIVAEYSDPNPFKVLHAGHLYTSIVGDAISNLLKHAGAEVHRVNFGGDVGLHVAKTMWDILRKLEGELPEKLNDIPEAERSEWMAEAYVQGSLAYGDDKVIDAEIVELNKRIYKLHDENDHDSPFARIYWTCRQWSYDYFAAFYASIGITFDKYYPESEVAPLGLKTVREQLGKGVYKESESAIVFEGEPHGLHTRVFINSEGLPTYEAKDVGLIIKKWDDFHFDQSVVITGNEIDEYMKVVLKSIEQFRPELVQKTSHLTHGMVRLAGGENMSSRKGNILRAIDVLDAANKANIQKNNQENEQTVLGAVKYAFIKQRTGGDIIYDPVESVSLEGNSGPYLQYAHARAKSILGQATNSAGALTDFEDGERSLACKISEFPEVIDRAVAELMPHHIATYLYELAQTFNRFYENNRVLGHEREAVRVALVKRYAEILERGLALLGIAAPDRM
jgi:arginyl-tRNA synthetase